MQFESNLNKMVDSQSQLAEDAMKVGASTYGDALVESVRFVWYCKPAFENERETVESWLARGGQIERLL